MKRFDRLIVEPLDLSRIFLEIDCENSYDSELAWTQAGAKPACLVYGQRMTAMLTRFQAQSSEELQVAVRAQHIRRFDIKRSAYEDGLAGYLRWRRALLEYHARQIEKILEAHGAGPAFMARVCDLVQKKNLKTDEETQTLEDVACLVFIEYYLADFRKKYAEEKVIAIIQKTAARMSAAALAFVASLEVASAEKSLLTRALSKES